VAYRTCEDCRCYVYDPKTGKQHQDRNKGGPLERPKHSKPPCQFCPKCRNSDEKSPRAGHAATLSPKNWKTFRLYHQQRIGGGTVTDPITRKNFGILAEMFDHYDRQQRQAMIATASVGAR
jgi:hypothetical protein